MTTTPEWLIRPVFTYVMDDGTNINLDVQNLRAWCLAYAGLPYPLGPERIKLEVFEKTARHFIDDNIASLDRVKELSLRFEAMIDPVILGKCGYNLDGSPRVMFIDGHHRYVLAYMSKRRTVPAFGLEVSQWRPFVIDGLPDMTQKELMDLPITKRSY